MEPRGSDIPIALIGLPASGKSTVAGILARRMGLPAVDLDDVIVREARRGIPAIFEAEGEAGFREREARALRAAAGAGAAVVATGGGIVLRPENRLLLCSRFRTVWLRVLPVTAAARSTGGARPLLACGDPEERIRELEAGRTSMYAACAEFSVDTEGRTPEAVAEAIFDQVR